MLQRGEGGLCFAVLTKKQTAGRGRLERSWESDINGNIYLTLCLHSSLVKGLEEIIPLYTAFSLITAIGEKARYKWANDVLIEGKKVAGILVERLDEFFIIGIGVNVEKAPLNTLFPATSLKENGLFLTPEQIFNSFRNNINLNVDFILNSLKKKFFTIDEVSINQGEFKGVMNDIIKNGSLILRQKNGTFKEINFGDVGV